jgi:hypothetical protein
MCCVVGAVAAAVGYCFLFFVFSSLLLSLPSSCFAPLSLPLITVRQCILCSMAAKSSSFVFVVVL